MLQNICMNNRNRVHLSPTRSIFKVRLYVVLFLFLLLYACSEPPHYDLLIRNATIADGSGGSLYKGDLAVNGDRILKVGPSIRGTAFHEVDATGFVAAPGFINMLSWATESLLIDGRGMSDLKQGVTLEVMGEGWSMGPMSDIMKKLAVESQGDLKYEITWNSLGEYLKHLESIGVSPNVASFVGATTLRIHEIGYEDRPPTDEELDRMKALAHDAMKEGALGIGSSLIYAPAFYADTDELIELCKVAAGYGGSYITHMRSEGNNLLQAVDEVIEIAAMAGIDAEIYHLKAAGQSNWQKIDRVIEKIDSARNAGLNITTDMYTYIAGATGLDASMPPWVQEGGYDEWARRLKDPAIRKKVIEEMRTDAADWENLYYSSGGAENLILVGFKNEALRKFTGKSLAEVAKNLGKTPEETAIDLVIEDGSRVGTVYFLMSEENIKKQIQLPYMSFGSDAGALAPEGVFLNSSTHPRAYGNFARLLGKYVREEEVIPLEEAIYKLTKWPATNLKIKKRGEIKEGYFADIVIFDPNSIRDHATFSDPHQYATGVIHVFVNGEQVIDYGEHTGAKPGRFIKGPGYAGGN